MYANKTHANRPSALTVADRARLAAHITGKPCAESRIMGHMFKLAAVVLVVGFLAGCI